MICIPFLLSSNGSAVTSRPFARDGSLPWTGPFIAILGSIYSGCIAVTQISLTAPTATKLQSKGSTAQSQTAFTVGFNEELVAGRHPALPALRA